MRLSLDTNVLVYAFDADAGERHRLAMAIVDRAAAANCVLTLQSLGETVRAQGKLDEAERYHTRALALREKGLAPDHPLLAQSVVSVGAVFADRGKHQQGISYF